MAARRWPACCRPGLLTSLRGRLPVILSIGLCAAVAGFLAFHELDRRPLQDVEARYALIAFEMLRSGDWIQPRLNTFPYYEKPPLLYWAIAVADRAFGVGEFSARVPSALAHVATTLLVFGLARSLLGTAAGACAGLMYATEVGPVLFARLSLTDGPLVCWLTLSLYGLVRATRRRGGWAAFSVGAAAAGLTKGLVGLVVPLATAAAYAVVARDRQLITRLHPGRGALLLAAGWLPWHVALSLRDPAFVHFYLLNEHVYRFLNVRDPIDYAPLSLVGFWASVLFWLLPWSLFLPAALLWARRSALAGLPLLWAAIVLGFFSLARSRLEKYGLPALPALSVVLAGYWRARAEDPRRRLALALPALVALLAAAPLIATAWAPSVTEALSGFVRTLDGYYREHPEEAVSIVSAAMPLGRPLSVVLMLLGLSAGAAALARRVCASFALWVAFVVPALMVVNAAALGLGAARSQREAAAIITREWRAGARVVVDGLYDDAMSVTFYTRRPTYLVGPTSGDLAFGFRRLPGSPLVLTREQFDASWRSPAPLFVLTERRPFPPGARVLLEGPRFSLVTNHPAGTRATPAGSGAHRPVTAACSPRRRDRSS